MGVTPRTAADLQLSDLVSDLVSDMPTQLDNDLLFNADGLIPAVAQQHDTGEVLMMAWMNRASIAETLQTGQVCYWSRSRQSK